MRGIHLTIVLAPLFAAIIAGLFGRQTEAQAKERVQGVVKRHHLMLRAVESSIMTVIPATEVACALAGFWKKKSFMASSRDDDLEVRVGRRELSVGIASTRASQLITI